MCGGIFVDMKYIECADLTTLEEQVKGYMKEGWTCCGNVTVSAFWYENGTNYSDHPYVERTSGARYVQRIELWKPKPRLEKSAR